MSRINDNLSRILAWAKENDVVINPVKSHAIIFSRKTPPSRVSCLKIGDDVIGYVDCTKSLGLHLSSDLSWKRHVNIICGQVYATLAMLRNSQMLLTTSMKRHLVKSLIVPKILYCSQIFTGMPITQWNVLKVCFNACVRYVFNLSLRTSVSPYVQDVLGCSLKQLAEFRACIFIHQLIAKQTPSYLAEILFFPRFQRHKMLCLPLTTGQKSASNPFFVAAPRLWNQLEPNLRRIESLSTFRDEYLDGLMTE